MKSMKDWIRSGTPWIWLNAAAVSACILLVVGLLSLIAWRGQGHFWPAAVHELVLVYEDGTQATLAGQLRDSEEVPVERLRESGVTVSEGAETMTRLLLKTGNRDVTGQDFVWLLADSVASDTRPANLLVLEREEWGTFFGRLVGLKESGELLPVTDGFTEFEQRLARAGSLRDEIHDLERGAIGSSFP
jgi:phosphate transport system permease protein